MTATHPQRQENTMSDLRITATIREDAQGQPLPAGNILEVAVREALHQAYLVVEGVVIDSVTLAPRSDQAIVDEIRASGLPRTADAVAAGRPRGLPAPIPGRDGLTAAEEAEDQAETVEDREARRKALRPEIRTILESTGLAEHDGLDEAVENVLQLAVR